MLKKIMIFLHLYPIEGSPKQIFFRTDNLNQQLKQYGLMLCFSKDGTKFRVIPIDNSKA